MTDFITSENNPSLWSTLYELYTVNRPGNVALRREMYKVHILDNEEIAFTKVDTIDYLDSRSFRGRRKASYDKMVNLSDVD